MGGTAPPLARVLLVHQPGPWGPRGLLESRCDPDTARRIDAAAAKAGMRLQTIRRPGKHEAGKPEGGYDVAIADTRVGEESITWWRTDDLADIVNELETGRPQRPPYAVETAALYLVCAHGRHDPCCALRGRPVAQALERVRPGRVWETTHLGGDRFAANVLVLPMGQLYGRVPPAVAPHIADRTDAGDVVPKFMRGHIGQPPIAQAALIFAHERLDITSRNALAVSSIRRVDEHRAFVHVDTPHGAIVVTVLVEIAEPARLTCNGSASAKARVYRAVEIGAAEPSTETSNE